MVGADVSTRGKLQLPPCTQVKQSHVQKEEAWGPGRVSVDSSPSVDPTTAVPLGPKLL